MIAPSPKLHAVVAAAQALLILPAALFMSALVVRGFQPLQYEPAHTAQLIVMWYAGKQWTLWVLLVGLPLTVLVAGCLTLLSGWAKGTRQTLAAIRTHLATIIVAAVTLTVAVILAIVALHILAD
jgi:hypothetical protein